MKQRARGFKRIIQAYTYSKQGFKFVLQAEPAFHQELIVLGIGTVISLCLRLSGIERAMLVFSLFFIVFMELVNTAIEVIIDRISEKYHPLSGHAKDIGSLLVLLSFLNAFLVWGLILLSS